MTPAEVVSYVRASIDPMEDDIYGPRYRCSATLKDGLYLPCVIVSDEARLVDLAMRRLEDGKVDAGRTWFNRNTGVSYRDMVRTFAAEGNRLSCDNIAKLDLSPFAIPWERVLEIGGETAMSWTQFGVVMKDGTEFFFGTSFSNEFFQMPDGYVGDDITEIIPHGESAGALFRERPYFSCFVSGLA